MFLFLEACKDKFVHERVFYVRMKAMVANGNNKTKQQEYIVRKITKVGKLRKKQSQWKFKRKNLPFGINLYLLSVLIVGRD